jgi:hypothetical protein
MTTMSSLEMRRKLRVEMETWIVKPFATGEPADVPTGSQNRGPTYGCSTALRNKALGDVRLRPRASSLRNVVNPWKIG